MTASHELPHRTVYGFQTLEIQDASEPSPDPFRLENCHEARLAKGRGDVFLPIERPLVPRGHSKGLNSELNLKLSRRQAQQS